MSLILRESYRLLRGEPAPPNMPEYALAAQIVEAWEPNLLDADRTEHCMTYILGSVSFPERSASGSVELLARTIMQQVWNLKHLPSADEVMTKVYEGEMV